MHDIQADKASFITLMSALGYDFCVTDDFDSVLFSAIYSLALQVNELQEELKNGS